MDDFKLINNVPAPDSLGKGGRAPRYPFRSMRIGQCFDLFTEKELAAARNAAWREKNKNPDFNYGAVEYGPDSQELERDETGDIIPDGRIVWGRLWRMP